MLVRSVATSVRQRLILNASYRCFAQASQRVPLNYQTPPPPGKTTGRYINQPDLGDVVDEAESHQTMMHDGRGLSPPATVDTYGFTLESWPTKVKDFTDDEEVVSVYYQELMELVKKTAGASRVFVFDHTIRETGTTNLNAEKGGKAAPVPRVHCDYTADGAPRRLKQLGAQGIHSRIKGRQLTPEEVDALAAGRFAFINVWRSICDVSPVMQQPLAVCDERSVPMSDRFLYELRFPDRTGENYSLQFNEAHQWYYYPQMTKDECMVFKVYDKKEDGPRFVFHTAFNDPLSTADAPPRRSIECRTVAFFDVPDDGKVAPPAALPIFFDMKHSNNAARIRLWMRLKENMKDQIERRVIAYTDLQTDEFQAVNPLKKVPALIRADGTTVFESAVILNYLEDKYGSSGPAFRPDTCEGRQHMELLVRIHDLYIASPNCTAPGFSHTQGSMYLSVGWHGPVRGMDAATRAAKLGEIWKQLTWLEGALTGPFLAGDKLTLADFTWYPTGVFMEYMLPRVFEWPNIFNSGGIDPNTPFPRLSAWYAELSLHPVFADTRDEIWQYWVEMDAEGQFTPIKEEVASEPTMKWRYP